MTIQNWAPQADGNYSGSATTDGVTVVAQTRATTNERGAVCYALDILVTCDGETQTYTAPGTFFNSVDWGALADLYAAHALAGRRGDDIFD